MFTRIITKPFTRSFIFICAIISLVVAAWLPSGVAYAEEDQPPVDPAQRGQKIDERLSKLYQREQEWLDRQADRLNNPAEVVARVEELISKASEKGRDVTALQTALTTYQASVAEAQAAHNQAAAILSAHKGFDDRGKVTDRSAAKQTLETAGKNLNQARHILNQAALKLRQVVRAWLKAQQPQGESQPQS